jgi:hypothetical protein
LIGGDWPEQPSPRFIFHRMLREKDLCPSPPECPEVLMENPFAGKDALPCPHCPVQLLRSYLETPGGRLMSIVIDLDFALQAGLAVTLDQISYPEFLLLRQLVEERDRHSSEQIQKKSRR